MSGRGEEQRGGGNGEYRQSVGEHTTLKTAIGGVQPTRIAHQQDGKASEDLASSIAQRTAGNPRAFERAPADDQDQDGGNDYDRKGEQKKGNDDNKGGGGPKKGHDDNKGGGGFGKFLKVPLIVSAIVLAIAGVACVLTAPNDKHSSNDIKLVDSHRSDALD